MVWPSFSRLFPPSRLKTRLDGSRTWAPHFTRDPGRSDRNGCQQQVALAESPVVSARRDDVDDDRTCGRGSAQTRPFRRAESIAGCQDRCIIIGHPAQDGTDPSGLEAPRLLRRRVHRHARSLSSRYYRQLPGGRRGGAAGRLRHRRRPSGRQFGADSERGRADPRGRRLLRHVLRGDGDA